MVTIPSCVKDFIVGKIIFTNVEKFWSHCWIKYTRFENFWQNVIFSWILYKFLLYFISFYWIKIFFFILTIRIFLTFNCLLWFFRLFNFFLLSHLFFQSIQKLNVLLFSERDCSFELCSVFDIVSFIKTVNQFKTFK